MQNQILKREVKRKGGVNAVAKELSVTPCAVYFWLNGTRQPSEEFLRYLGLERREAFVKVKNAMGGD